jgi:hypothetical protein
VRLSNRKIFLVIFIFIFIGALYFFTPLEIERSGGDRHTIMVSEIPAISEEPTSEIETADPIRLTETALAETRIRSIVFDNGREVQVQLKQRVDQLAYFAPTAQFLDLYDDLKEAALSGNGIAAVQLYSNLENCKLSYRTKSELDQAIRKLQEDHTVEWPAGTREPHSIAPGIDHSVYVADLTERYTLCKGITNAHLSNTEQWARIAVDAGEYMGTRLLARELGKTQESFELWQAAWDAGHINAATALLLYYRRGVPDHMGGQPDYVRTYAYQLIRNKVYESAMQEEGSADAGRLQAMDNALRATGGHLNAQEQALAEDLAADMLEANINCCFGPWRWPN